ncbi:MAG: PhaM family polyhydroxyalkanoate granule multifunctional regulatory protein [Rubrivivax sp.]
MSSAADFTRQVPGFDFLQGLLKNAGAGLPNVGQWIAPTLDPDELDKRIQELKTVQFWLEQNARLLATTIQALEVQRMTLATLRGMNLPLAELKESLKIKPFAAPAPAPEPQAEPEPEPEAPARPRRKAAPRASAAAAPAPAAVDPMQWWGALTQQFTELAAQALKDGTRDGARGLAGAVVKQSVDAAGSALRAAASLPAKAAEAAAGAAAKPARRAPPRRR